VNELVLQLRDALDDGDDHRAAWLLEELFVRADRRRPLRRRVWGRSLRSGPDTRRPGHAGPPPKADW